MPIPYTFGVLGLETVESTMIMIDAMFIINVSEIEMERGEHLWSVVMISVARLVGSYHDPSHIFMENNSIVKLIMKSAESSIMHDPRIDANVVGP